MRRPDNESKTIRNRRKGVKTTHGQQARLERRRLRRQGHNARAVARALSARAPHRRIALEAIMRYLRDKAQEKEEEWRKSR